MDWISPQNILMAIGVLALVVASHWVRSWIEPEPTPRLAVEWKQHAMTEEDVPTPTNPNGVTVYETPDNTRTECFQAPLWLGSSTISPATDSARRKSDVELMQDTSASLSADQTGSLPQMAGPPYVITPMIDGRPSLSVGSQTVTLSAINPRTGAGLEYSYDVPTPDWSIDAVGTVTASKSVAVGTSALYLTHHSERFELGIGPAGHVVVTDGGYAAEPAISARVETSLYSW